MVVGVDFDNTIVCWDDTFHAAALQRRLIIPDVPKSKAKIRDYLRGQGREEAWIELQGHVYGALTPEAATFPGVADFFMSCRRRGVRTVIISHKTRYPFAGPRYDLHAAARTYLQRPEFCASDGMGLSCADVYFELTKAYKLNRIGEVGCSHFIDDLPEFLTERSFPSDVDRILFDPNMHHDDSRCYRRATSWMEIQQWLLGGR